MRRDDDRRLRLQVGPYVIRAGWSWEFGCYGIWFYGERGPRRPNGQLRSSWGVMYYPRDYRPQTGFNRSFYKDGSLHGLRWGKGGGL